MPLVIEYRPFALPEAPPPGARAVTPGELAKIAGAHQSRAVVRPTGPRVARPAALAAIAALAVLSPFGWDGSALQPSAAQANAPRLQPFEAAGENFPGSAFYYLDSDSGVVAPERAARSSERPAPLDARLGDAIARPTFLAGTARDRSRALSCLTTAIYHEAAAEPDAGQRAVAQVVLNRIAHPQWPNSVCGVVFQGSERPGCQFSFACDGSLARAPVRMWWDRARRVAERALAGEVYAPVGLATYYHTAAVHPAWAERQTFIGAIGAHLFYRLPGGAGTAGAFTDRYRGGEPVAAPNPRPFLPPPLLQADPLAVAQTWAAAWDSTAGSLARPALPFGDAHPALAHTPVAGDALSASGQIRPEYRDSGRWIASPKG
ncbi:cell wall hydrolase [Novosphingobium sp. Gsoil 351]|uniref:cell wall hydrolase n=1 Tax=Novosphingobium sp. Gsoil 351 TaxID=2675225 RepID=UPI0012B443F1|nr:cell wall hydrolase [Novosphingobium sp. Gsoil 351]QGN54302.1 cell wall hydrolase [Novosphingobium sp. Gsoil 351]